MTEAKAKTSAHRIEVYKKQNGNDTLTLAQGRRIRKQKKRRIAQNKRRAAKEQASE